jgi:hypothetical protein
MPIVNDKVIIGRCRCNDRRCRRCEHFVLLLYCSVLGCAVLAKKYGLPPPPSANKMAKLFKNAKFSRISQTFIILELFHHEKGIQHDELPDEHTSKCP